MTQSHSALPGGGRVLVILLGIAGMALASQATIPQPGSAVPITLQSLAVLVIGGACGPRLGALTMAGYLALGAVGVPLFAIGTSGLARLVGPPGGYLLSFPLAAAATGAIVRSNTLRQAGLGALTGMVLIHLGGITQLLVLGHELQVALQPSPAAFATASFAKVGVAALLIPWLRRRIPLPA